MTPGDKAQLTGSRNGGGCAAEPGQFSDQAVPRACSDRFTQSPQGFEESHVHHSWRRESLMAEVPDREGLFVKVPKISAAEKQE